VVVSVFIRAPHYSPPSALKTADVSHFRVGYGVLCGPGSVVGIATGYGLDGPGIESRWGQDFPNLSIPTLRPAQPPVQWVPGFSRG
jgi:hypothetical protein